MEDGKTCFCLNLGGTLVLFLFPLPLANRDSGANPNGKPCRTLVLVAWTYAWDWPTSPEEYFATRPQELVTDAWAVWEQ